MNYLTLNNGVRLPQQGYGTWFIEDGVASQAVRTAVSLGYRHVDTAQAYGNEHGVGDGIRICGVPREELFATSKVAAEHKTYREAADSIEETLEVMGLEYFGPDAHPQPQPWAERRGERWCFRENRE